MLLFYKEKGPSKFVMKIIKKAALSTILTVTAVAVVKSGAPSKLLEGLKRKQYLVKKIRVNF